MRALTAIIGAGVAAAGIIALLWPAYAAGKPVLNVPTVHIVAPAVIGGAKQDTKSAEECTTGCSLAKHKIPDFTPDDYLQAIADYAGQPHDADTKPLETLLFYGSRTLQLMQRFGTEGLPSSHLVFLRRELSRTHARVSIRLIDANDRVRVSYGPSRVPLGQKQHLQAVTLADQSLEFNGTVMRVGLYHLWSRY